MDEPLTPDTPFPNGKTLNNMATECQEMLQSIHKVKGPNHASLVELAYNVSNVYGMYDGCYCEQHGEEVRARMRQFAETNCGMVVSIGIALWIGTECKERGIPVEEAGAIAEKRHKEVMDDLRALFKKQEEYSR